MDNLTNITSQFAIKGTVNHIRPLGSGLINDSYLVSITEPEIPGYVLQRINHSIFKDVEVLQRNILAVTSHIRKKLEEKKEEDIDRKVLTCIPTLDEKYYYFDGVNYWRLMLYIPDASTIEEVSPMYSYCAGLAFGEFQSMLADIDEELSETIPDFHNMEFRLQQFRDALDNNPSSERIKKAKPLIDELNKRATEMCKAERLYREGVLPKRICHCDTKVNNMMFDQDGEVLCIIDLDTVMPSFIFSDYGDFLRTAANAGKEDDENLENVFFRMEIFESFTKGYLESAASFLLPIEISNLPYAIALFPYMQTVRFLTDYINGDIYYKTQYPEHNLVRSKAQFKLLTSIEEHTPEIEQYIRECLTQYKN